MRIWKTLISCVAMTAVTAVSEAAAGTSYNKLTIVNNFDSTVPQSMKYFNSPVADNQIWLYLAGGSSSVYFNLGVNPPVTTPSANNTWTPNSWKRLDSIKSPADSVATLWVPRQDSTCKMYAVIWNGSSAPTAGVAPPAGAPLPAPTNGTNENSGCQSVGLAYALLEWNLDPSPGGAPNCDSSNVDQVSFPTRLTTYSGYNQTESSDITNQSGFQNNHLASEVMSALDLKYYQGVAPAEQNTNDDNGLFIPHNTPLGSAATGPYWPGKAPHPTAASGCQSGQYTKKVIVDTNGVVPSGTAYRYASPNQSVIARVVTGADPTHDYIYLAQCNSSLYYLLDYLYKHPRNNQGLGDGFFFNVSGNRGFAFNLVVKKDPNGAGPGPDQAGYGLVLKNFKGNPLGANSWAFPYYYDSTISLGGTLTLAADGVAFPNANITGAGSGNYYGLWTTYQMLLGAAGNTTINAPYGGTMTAYPTDTTDIHPRTCLAHLDAAAFAPGGLAHSDSPWGSCHTADYCYNSVLSSAIGRVSTALLIGMNVQDWSSPTNSNQHVEGFAYQSALMGTECNTKMSGNGCLDSNMPGCYPQGTIPLDIGCYTICPTTSFFKIGDNPAQGLINANQWLQVLLNQFGLTGQVPGTSIYSAPPYFSPYGDNFQATSCDNGVPGSDLFSPDLALPGNSSMKWELGVLTTNPTPPNNCCTLSTDINGDGDTSGPDLTLLLGGFGTNQSNLDFDDSGIVDGGDLAKFLAAWEQGDSPTPCPDRKCPSWATVVTACPDQSIVTSNTLRDNIVNSGWAWKVKDNTTGIQMVWIPLVTTIPTFMMGCSPAGTQTAGCLDIEKPIHGVILTSAVYNNEPGFYMSVGEVTQAEWMYPGNTLLNPSHFVGSNLPVETVKYGDVKTWLQNASTGSSAAPPMRLPTEAEWEYAYRAGTTTAFHGYPDATTGSNDPSTLMHIAWYAANSEGKTHAITDGSLQPNGFGLYNMSGNVWEWVNDYRGAYNDVPTDVNPTGVPLSNSTCAFRSEAPPCYVLRGGHWGDNTTQNGSDFLRSSTRGGYPDVAIPVGERGLFGFRVARNAESPSP